MSTTAVQPPGIAQRRASRAASLLHSVAQACVRGAEYYLPDPFLLAIVLTVVACGAALTVTGSGAGEVLDAWYGGLWAVMPFAFQMALVLCSGVALARAPVIKRVMRALAKLPRRQSGAAITIFLTAAIGCWINWGFGLVIGALLAREIAQRQRHVDFSFLVAAAYMGFMVWASGLSSSIALATATQSSPLNFIEHLTGHAAGFSQTVFTPVNLAPVLVLLTVMPAALVFMAPAEQEMKRVDPEILAHQDNEDEADWNAYAQRNTFATRLENSRISTGLLTLLGAAFTWHAVATRGFSIDIDGFIFAALFLGLVLHGTPIRYAHAFYTAARTVGPILLQFPIYGGVMGIMAHTGLASLIAQTFVSLATTRTFGFWTFISSCIVSLFVPSGGGQWAVVGPFVVPAAISLKADPSMAAVGTAMGVQTASMIQPFWALPVLALARLGIKDIMGYCVIAMLLAVAAYGGSLLLFGG